MFHLRFQEVGQRRMQGDHAAGSVSLQTAHSSPESDDEIRNYQRHWAGNPCSSGSTGALDSP